MGWVGDMAGHGDELGAGAALVACTAEVTGATGGTKKQTCGGVSTASCSSRGTLWG